MSPNYQPGQLIQAGRTPFLVSECDDGHVWGHASGDRASWECCCVCGMVRRRDRQNQPCRGYAPRVTPRLAESQSGAILDADRTYRYALWRWFGESRDVTQTVAFIGLNPSTADETTNDPTIIRCMNRAKRLDASGLVMLNLFAWRAMSPRELRQIPDPVGPENDAVLVELARAARRVIVAWGNGGTYRGRDLHVYAMLAALGVKPECLTVTASGSPRHPLYVMTSQELQYWSPPSS